MIIGRSWEEVIDADLPELHADGTVQLHQACLQVHGLALRVVQVDGGALVVVALDLPQVHTQVVTQFAELRLASVLEAKLESCRAHHGMVRVVLNKCKLLTNDGLNK